MWLGVWSRVSSSMSGPDRNAVKACMASEQAQHQATVVISESMVWVVNVILSGSWIAQSHMCVNMASPLAMAITLRRSIMYCVSATHCFLRSLYTRVCSCFLYSRRLKK